MVKLAPYLVADSLESYRVDHIDGESIAALFDDEELERGLAFRQSIPLDLMSRSHELARKPVWRRNHDPDVEDR